MTREKLSKLQRTIDGFRAARHNIRSTELVSLARSLGREKSKKGKHPTYESLVFSDLNPVSIPGHPGAMKARTAMSILDDLELDILRFSQRLDEEERKANEQQPSSKRLPAAAVRPDSDT